MDINLLRERDNISTFTVSELNTYIKNILDGNRTLSSITVKGEISNLTCHRSGHIYFTLKDPEGQLKAVMFRSHAARLKFAPESGMRVIAHGSISAYTRDGTYQLYASSLQPDGIGALYLAYEQLKERLAAEGLFDEVYKRQIPRYPSKIGVITSPTGAAVRDILNVTKRRYPIADVYVYPALVQGDGAAETLIRGVEYFDSSRLCDVVIIGRGGGSIEDLWAFNDERLARRIFSAKVPIISAVGHETDFTICDFVSDLRAPTPSAAAELAIPDIRELLLLLDGIEKRCTSALKRAVESEREKLSRYGVSELCGLLRDRIEAERKTLSELMRDSENSIEKIINDMKGKLAVTAEKCNAMSPLSVLSRGYSVIEKGGVALLSVDQADVGDNVRVIMHDGRFDAEIKSVRKKKGKGN